MAHHKAEAKASGAAKLRALSSSKSVRMPGAETVAPLPPIGGPDQNIESQTMPTRKRGGRVEGDAPAGRMDRPCRATGGRVKKSGKTIVNVMIAPQGGASQPQPVPVPVPAGGPPPMAGPPPMPHGGQPPVVLPPPQMGGGGDGGGGMPPPMGRKAGGRVTSEAGAGSGPGRLQKAEAEKRAGRGL